MLAACSPVVPELAAGTQTTKTVLHASTATPTPMLSPTPFISATSSVTTTPLTSLPPLAVGSPIDLSWLNMLDAENGWAIGGPHDSGSSSYVFRTFDSGESWIDVTPPIEAESVPDAIQGGFFGFAFSATTAWITYRSGTKTSFAYTPPVNPVVWRTNDSGQTWQASTPLDIYHQGPYSVHIMTFSTPKNGWILTGIGIGGGSEAVTLHRSTDGGLNWQLIQDPIHGGFSSGYKTGMVFSDAIHGWYTGYCSACMLPFKVGQTNDGGLNWKDILSGTIIDQSSIFGKADLFPVNMSCYPSDPVIRNNQVFIGISCQNRSEDNSLAEYISCYLFRLPVNGGGWTYLAYPGGDIVTLDGKRIWSFGRGIISLSEDAGKNWRKISTVDWKGTLDFVTPTLGWAVAQDYSNNIAKYWLYQTKDGGESWDLVNPIVAAASGT